MYNLISEQWQKFIDKGCIPVFDMMMSDGRYLLIELTLLPEGGIMFEFDTDKYETYFSGDVLWYAEGSYILPFDEFNTESLAYYLQKVYDEVVEGFLIPNNLDKSN